MKKVIVVFAVIATALVSQASELWWTVNGADTASTDVDGSSIAWETAKLYASTTGFNYGGQLVDSVSAAYLDEWGNRETALGGYDSSAYSFYVELWNSSERVGRSYVSNGSLSSPQGGMTYDSLNAAGAIGSGTMMAQTGGNAYSFSQFTTSEVIPEPTSGLLMLLGMMALGLKRKKV